MKRLIAVSIEGSWEGEWQTAQGNERAVITSPIGKGEKVWLETIAVEGGSGVLRKTLVPSETPLLVPVGLTRYRVVKEAGALAEKCPTTVEMILSNGKGASSG